jgi:uncharacterized protein YjaG (DUF416 family)
MERVHVNLDENNIIKVDSFNKEHNIKSRSETINKAIAFYIDYNNNKEPGDFLAEEIQAIMTGNMELVEKRLGNRIGKLLSDVAIQLGIQQQIFKSITNLKEEDISLFRKIAVDEIKNNQRIFRYEDLINK